MCADVSPQASSWIEGVSQQIFLQFANCTNEQVQLFWVDYDGEEVSYGAVNPGKIVGQSE